MDGATFMILSDHPALPGHFPGNPIVPGVLLLAHVQRSLEARIGPVCLTGLPQVKFLAPLLPGEACVVSFSNLGEGQVHFACHSGARRVARGSLRFQADARRPG